jgi:hypothetical protein
MKKLYLIPSRKRIIVVDLFAGMGLFAFGLRKSGMIIGYACEWNFHVCHKLYNHNFKHPDGTPVMEPFIVIPREEYEALRSNKDTKDTVGIIDGQWVRTKRIQEVNGRDIRRAIEARYGKDIIIVVAGGPPCQLLTSLSKRGREATAQADSDEKNSVKMLFEYLRILEELSVGEGNGNVCGVMEEVPEIGEKQFFELYSHFITKARTLPFNIAELDMCSSHHGGNQMRWRKIFQFVHKSYNVQPVFPEADTVNVKRVKDFLEIDSFLSGHFIDTWKTKNHLMCTVTKGSPKEFKKGEKRWKPSDDELLLCFDVKPGEYFISPDISVGHLRQAIANAVCVSLSSALGKNLIEKVLRLRPDGEGFFIPIDTPTDDEDTSPIEVSPEPRVPVDDGVELSPVAATKESETAEVDTSDPGESAVTMDGNIQPNTTAAADNKQPSIDAADTQVINSATMKDATTLTSEPVNLPPALSNGNKESTNMPIKFYESGFELWRGKSQLTGANIVVIITLHSANTKTGDMAQTWILNADISPLEAIRIGDDTAICGDCSLRHNKGGGCYVYVAQSPRAVWEAWHNQKYTKLPVEHFKVLSGLPVRHGAYGDPAAMPMHILKEIQKYVVTYTGYTHQWRATEHSELKTMCMASVENPEQQLEAAQKGWRTYRIIKPGDELLQDEILCPHITTGVQCVKCRLCRGTAHPAKNIAVHAHGIHVNKFNLPSPAVLPRPVTKVEEIHHLPRLRNLCITDTEFKKVEGPKIINSLQLRQMKFQSLNFEGRWGELLGLPSVNFHCIIHGLSGHGKSTFGIQFAKYLADFGRVLYVSGEEGLFKTFQDKFTNSDAWSDSIDVAEIKTYDELIRIVIPDTYNFIFLDSLDAMKIDITRLKKIKDTFKNSALITISQSTKTGLMRGSNEIMHEGDVCVRVTDGLAETTKNRFKEKGTAFNVFQQMSDSEDDL